VVQACVAEDRQGARDPHSVPALKSIRSVASLRVRIRARGLLGGSTPDVSGARAIVCPAPTGNVVAAECEIDDQN
jgi:hypothetical protein